MLTDALAGRGIRSCTGLDDDTENALWAICDADPDGPAGDRAELVAAARRAFAGQLDGSNAARWRENLARKIAERSARAAGGAD
ncbi:hypothetical protein [Kitasatospora sp. NPDC097643]|uniref:hypothetical protein n=1 Tax=Kitasatospora sp. NPDC097643 TaxID=3157230 RepID=UPI00332BF99C